MSEKILIHAAYVVPVRPSGAVLQDHSVVIERDRIIAVLPTAEARARFAPTVEIELDRHVLMPGLINMHTHSPMTLFRGFADDKDMQDWLTEDIWPLEARFVDYPFVEDGTRLAIAEMIRAGTTCFNDNYFFPDAMADVTQAAGMRACIGLPIIEMPTAWAGNVDDYFDRGLELIDRYSAETRLRFSLAPHAPYTVSDQTLDRIAMVAGERELPVHMHLLETAWDNKHSLREYGITPLQRLDARGLLSDRMLAVHMTQLTQSDIRLIAERSVNVIHCPESNLKLASGICPLRALVSAGVNVAIGTDGAASNNDLDLLGEARTAALLSKGVAGDARAPTAFDLLEMLTINAARALGLDHLTGSIEVGKQADLAALDLYHARTQPLHNVVSTVVYSASSAQFTDVWVDGQYLLRDGELVTLDEDAVLGTAREWGRRIGRSRDVQSAEGTSA